MHHLKSYSCHERDVRVPTTYISAETWNSLPNSRHSQVFGKNYAAQLPKGFSVRVFKGPTLSSFPRTATAKFDIGYHTIPTAEPRPSQNYYPARPQSTTKSYSGSNEQPKSSRSHISDPSTATSRDYDSSSRPPITSYSIYPGVSKDIYVYERSLSSKSDIYSNSEYDASTLSPSSIFSPAMSTDSLTTLKSPMTPPTTLSDRDLRSSTPVAPTSSRNSFAMHIPVLSQAQSAIRGIFRSQTPHEDLPPYMDNSFIPHAPSSRLSAIPDSTGDAHSRAETPGVQGRSTTPIRLSSVSSGSENRNTATGSASYPTPNSGYINSRYRSDIVEDSEESDLDRIARANTEYNAASSAQFHTRRQSADEIPNGFGETPAYGQLFPDFPLRSSPEQRVLQHNVTSSYIGESIREAASSYFSTTDTTIDVDRSRAHSAPPRNHVQPQFDDHYSDHSEEFLPPLAHREWLDPIMGGQPPTRRQSEPERGAIPIPQILNEGPQNRYVPASRTMTPRPVTSAPARPEDPNVMGDYDRLNERPLPIPPPPSQQRGGRDRRSSVSQPQNGTIAPSSTSFNDVREGSTIPSSRVEREAEYSRAPAQPFHSSAPYISRDSTVPRGLASSTSTRGAAHSEPPAPRRDFPNARVGRDAELTRGSAQPLYSSISYVPRDSTIPRDFASTSPRDGVPRPSEVVGSSQNAQTGIYDSTNRNPPGQRPGTSASYPTRDAGVLWDGPSATLSTRARESAIPSSDRATRPLRNSQEDARDGSAWREVPQLGQHVDPSNIYSTRDLGLRDHNIALASTQRLQTSIIPPNDRTPRPQRNSPEEARDSFAWRAPQPEISRNYAQTETRQYPSEPSNVSRYLPPATSMAGGGPRNMSPPRSVVLPPTSNSRDQGAEAVDKDRFTGRNPHSMPDSGLGTSRPFPTTGLPTSRLGSGPAGAGVVTGQTGRTSDVAEPPHTGAINNPNFVDGGQRSSQRSRRPSFATEPQREGVNISTNSRTVERPSFSPFEQSSERPATASTSPKTDARSRAQAPELRRPMPEPHRRHSDGDRSVNNDIPLPHSTTPHMPSTAQSVPERSSRTLQPTPAPVEPQRRFSDGDQVAPPHTSGGNALVLSRNVRWNENLVCPSPIFASQRRKGWFNRRGDQLWTNEGSYKPLPLDQQYPPDLDSYPEHGEGWMNEEGVRIDMQHRLIPKQPLRSALKQTRAQHSQLNTTVTLT